MAPEPFARWLQSFAEQKQLYRDLEPVDREEWRQWEDFEPRCQFEVFFCPRSCWKCGKDTLIFHGAADRGICATHFLYQAQVIEELDKLRQGFRLPPFGCTKPRSSRTNGTSSVSQGCSHCDALMGEYPLWEDFIAFFNSTDLDAYPFRSDLDWCFVAAGKADRCCFGMQVVTFSMSVFLQS